MEKRKLLLITDWFPYGNKESFLEAEIPHLLNIFELVIIATSGISEEIRQLDHEVQVIQYKPKKCKNRILSYLYYFLLYLFSHEGKVDFIEILKDRKLLIKRTINSVKFFSGAEKFCSWLKKNNLINNHEEIICYFYWSNYKALSLVRHRKSFPLLKTLARLHGYDLYNERRTDGRQPFKRTIDKNLDKVIFVSEYGMNYYLKSFKIEKTDKHVISRLGTENSFGCAPFNKNTSFDLVSCSNVIPLKRVNLIIDALALIDNIYLNWQHFGAGTSFKQINEYAKEKLSHKKNIQYTFHGSVSNKNILSFYEASKVDCFITTSSTEGGNPVSIMEALSFGIPIIATAVGGITEMLYDTDNFLLSQNPEPVDIKEAIQYVFDMDLYSIEKLRKQCAELWERNYTASKNYSSFVKMLNTL